MVIYLKYQDLLNYHMKQQNYNQSLCLMNLNMKVTINLLKQYLSTSTEVYDFYTKSLQKKEIVDKNFIEIDGTYLFKLFIEKLIVKII